MDGWKALLRIMRSCTSSNLFQTNVITLKPLTSRYLFSWGGWLNSLQLDEDLPICFRYWSTGKAFALASFLPILVTLRRNEKKNNILSYKKKLHSHLSVLYLIIYFNPKETWHHSCNCMWWKHVKSTGRVIYLEVNFDQAGGSSYTYICYT